MGTFLHYWWKYKLMQPLWKTVGGSLKKKTENRVTIWSTNSLPRYTSVENSKRKDTCTPMFIAALFIIAKTCKKPKCPLSDEWLKKIWYIYTMEYYSVIKKNKITSFAALKWTWNYHTKWSKTEILKKLLKIES